MAHPFGERTVPRDGQTLETAGDAQALTGSSPLPVALTAQAHGFQALLRHALGGQRLPERGAPDRRSRAIDGAVAPQGNHGTHPHFSVLIGLELAIVVGKAAGTQAPAGEKSCAPQRRWLFYGDVHTAIMVVAK